MAAILAGSITYFFNKRLRLSRAQHALTQVMAAATDLPAGMTLAAKDVSTIDWPSDIPLPGSFSKPEDVIGHPLIFSIGAREPILKRDLGL